VDNKGGIEMNKENLQKSRIAAAVAAALLGIAGPASGQDTSQRVEELEEAVKSLTKEIDSLKGQVNDNKEETTAVQQKVDSSVPTASLGEGVEFSDPRGNWTLRFNGRIQGDYRTYDPNGISASTFGLRRARIGAALTVQKDYQMYVEVEFINGAATGTTAQTAALTNGWLDAAWFKAARVRIGQFKPQFGFENSMPDVLTDFQERALTQSLLQNLNYDRGIMVHGAPIDGMYYGVTVSNGAGLNLEESQGNTAEARTDGKDVSVRLVQNFAAFLNVPDLVLHFGGSYKNGSVTSRGGTAFSPATVQTEARGITFFNTASLSGTSIDRTIWVAENTVAYGPVKVQGEYWQARYESNPAGAYDRKLDAYYVSLGWMITGEAYADSYRGGVYGRLRPRNNFSMEDGGGWGAWEFALRYSAFDGSDFTTTNAAGTGVLGPGAATLSPPVTVSTNKADAYTVQLKWLANAYTRFLVNYVQTNFDTPVTANGVTTDNEKAITFRAQFDF
jgi:phosphate-selective porin OprO/OprP